MSHFGSSKADRDNLGSQLIAFAGADIQLRREIFVIETKDLLDIARVPMPFGRYQGTVLIDLPEPYVVWFSKKGFPEGRLGHLLALLYEIKLNGLEYLFKDLR